MLGREVGCWHSHQHRPWWWSRWCCWWRGRHLWWQLCHWWGRGHPIWHRRERHRCRPHQQQGLLLLLQCQLLLVEVGRQLLLLASNLLLAPLHLELPLLTEVQVDIAVCHLLQALQVVAYGFPQPVLTPSG